MLFFFTATFPYGTGESFIENEISILADSFDKVVIISNCKKGNLREMPQNVVIEYFPYNLNFIEKIQALKEFYNPLYIKEIENIKKIYELQPSGIFRNIILTSIYKAKKASKYIKSLRFKYAQKQDNIFLYSYWMNDMAVGCAYAKSEDNAFKFICRAHGWDVYFERHFPEYLPFRNYIAQQADSIFFISRHGLDYFIRKNKIQNISNIHVSYLGTTSRNQKSYIRDKNKFNIVSCSSIIPLKQLDKIVEALSFLDNRFLIHWTHLGGGNHESFLKEKADEFLKNKTNISWNITGNIQNKEVLEFYEKNQVDLFINTSRFEGLPVSIMEAYSYSIPAIAPDIGGVKEIIDDKENGCIFSPDASSEEIAEIIKYFVEMPDNVYLNMRQNAFSKWQSHFDAEKNYKNFVESM